VERLIQFRELGMVADRATPEMIDELRATFAATIARYPRRPGSGGADSPEAAAFATQ